MNQTQFSNALVDPPREIELLAPAGDQTCLKAAIENGADAVYFGLDCGFNARQRAENLSLENLDDTMARLHQRQVKGYVTLNTLVFSDELAEFERIVTAIAKAGVDAVLVQDLGVAQLVRMICPDLAVHASTQMTMTSAECIAAIEAWGVQRVVLARELSIDEIRHIAKATTMPLEVFAHGALCVAYSGQCLTSESLGGRRANRGQCAQACRLPYDLFCDGKEVDLERVKFLLSPQDLAAYDHIPQLLDAGVTSLKIEGRLKSPEYVASVTSHYRTAIDQAISGRTVALTADQVEEMEMTFSRGFSPGWFEGCDHKRLVPGVSSAKRGIHVGRVVDLEGDRVVVQLQRALKAGDGVMFDVGNEQNAQPGGRVFQLLRNNRRIDGPAESGVVQLTFRDGTIDLALLRAGCEVWKTDDPHVSRRLRGRFEVTRPLHKLSLSISVVAKVGEPLSLRAQLPGNVVVQLKTDEPLQAARKHAVSKESLTQQLGRLGKTRFELAELTLESSGEPMVPHSVLGVLRHRLVECLEEKLAQPVSRDVEFTFDEGNESAIDRLRPIDRRSLSTDDASDANEQSPVLHVLCRTLDQLRWAVSAGATRISVDFADIRQYDQATKVAQSAKNADQRVELFLATPRIHKPGENGIFLAMNKHSADGWLVRNLAAVEFCRSNSIRFVTDYSLNVANELTARVIHEMGPERITASYDLNRDQLMRLVAKTPAAWLEVVVHQHMPMFHMEHCVFCAVMSPGTNKTNCGRPCDDHVVHLRDRVGMKHLLTADVGCRNTLFNATPQSGAEVVGELSLAGVNSFRVELLEESTIEQVTTTIQMYQQLLDGQVTAQALLAELNAINRVGLTRGTLEAARDPLAIL